MKWLQTFFQYSGLHLYITAAIPVSIHDWFAHFFNPINQIILGSYLDGK